MLFIWLIVIIPLVVAGLFMRKGRGLMLLAGYNTMPKEERDRIDKRALGKTAGNLLLRMAAEFALMGVAYAVEMNSLGMLFMVVFGVDIVVSMVRMNRHSTRTRPGKTGIIVALTITVLVFIAVGLMFYFGDKDPVVAIEGDELGIQCIFGISIPLANIASVQLDERSAGEIVPDARRTNGYGGFGDALKGSFSSKGAGSFRMYVRSKSSPTIVITTGQGETVYISMQNPGNTIELYESILDAMPD